VAIAPAAHPKLVPWITGQLGFLSGPASLFMTKPIARFFHARTLGHPEKVNHDLIALSLNTYRSPAAIRTALSAMRAIRDSRILEEKFDSHTLILYGEKDKVVPRWVIDKLMPRLANATLVLHKTGGHQLQQDDPEWTAQKILDFLPHRLV
jgi:pimeloyl-ACP methyl ester carboxylesterase